MQRSIVNCTILLLLPHTAQITSSISIFISQERSLPLHFKTSVISKCGTTNNQQLSLNHSLAGYVSALPSPSWCRTEVNIAVCCQFFNQSRWWVWHFHDIFAYEHEKYLPKCQNLNFTIFFIVCAMPCQETRPEDNNNNNSSSAAHNWRHFPQGASVATALPASLSTSSSSLYLTALSLTAHAFPMAFPRSRWGFSFAFAFGFVCFALPLPSRHLPCVCVSVSVCVQLLLNPHHTRWLRFLAFPPLRRRFTFIHQKKNSLVVDSTGNWKWKRNLSPTFHSFPSSFSCLRKMSRHFWMVPS